jgi:acyl-coenzyme A thioesterase PaaI-like protein
MRVEAGEQPSEHILQELGFTITRADGEDHGSAPVVPEMWVPGTSSLRTSILATWADVASGHLAIDVLAPRVPVTLALDVHVYAPPPADGSVHAVARGMKAGRSVVVVGVDFTDGDGGPIAVGTASFMAAPDPDLTIPPEIARMETIPSNGPLKVPFAERAGCVRQEPGVAVLRRSDDGLNSSNTVQGGLVALAVEEAALSLTPGAALASMAMHYLRPVRIGPAVATATVRAGVARVEVRDAGADDRLAVVATTRTFDQNRH